MDTDASQDGIGGVLSQVQDGEEKVIGYFSRTLSKQERNYCVTRRELLAIVKTLEHFHKYLYGRKFLIRTDHSALRWLLGFKDPQGQTARWLERLQEYEFSIQHRAGLCHGNADALSRRPCPEDCGHCSKMDDANVIKISRTSVDSLDAIEFMDAQRADPDLRLLIDAKIANVRPQWSDISSKSPNLKCYWSQWDSLVLEGGILVRVFESPDGRKNTLQIVVPTSKIADVLECFHNGCSGGHLGRKKTLMKIRDRFYWVNCHRDVEQWCKNCYNCASSKGPKTKLKAPMKLYNVGYPFERVAVDIVGPFPRTVSGNRYIMVVNDYFSKWPEAFAIPSQDAKTVAAQLVENVVCRFGVPQELHSDQGSNFESEVFQEICQIMRIVKTRSTPMHPQSDGLVERFNRTLEQYLSKVVAKNQKDWDTHIQFFLLAYRSAIHESTGCSPSVILFGRELVLPADLRFGIRPHEELLDGNYVSQLRKKMNVVHEFVRDNIDIASGRMKKRYDRRCNSSGFQQGDLVWLYQPQRKKGLSPKLQSSWDGPFEIISRINDLVYRVRKGSRGKFKVVSLDRLAPYSSVL